MIKIGHQKFWQVNSIFLNHQKFCEKDHSEISQVSPEPASGLDGHACVALIVESVVAKNPLRFTALPWLFRHQPCTPAAYHHHHQRHVIAHPSFYDRLLTLLSVCLSACQSAIHVGP